MGSAFVHCIQRLTSLTAKYTGRHLGQTLSALEASGEMCLSNGDIGGAGDVVDQHAWSSGYAAFVNCWLLSV